jgi:hypothetical protein
MAELLRLLAFAVFVALGLRARRRQGEGRRRAVGHLIGYVLLLSALAGALQRDAWPFTSHTIAVGRARADSRVCQTAFQGVDAGGRAFRLDPYTFTPVFDSILQYWVEQALPRLDAAQRGRVLGFLLARAEASRRRLAAGLPIGPQRLLGPAAAPYWLLLPRRPEAPDGPYAGILIETSCWTPTDASPSGRRDVTSRRLAEWPPR